MKDTVIQTDQVKKETKIYEKDKKNYPQQQLWKKEAKQLCVQWNISPRKNAHTGLKNTSAQTDESEPWQKYQAQYIFSYKK